MVRVTDKQFYMEDRLKDKLDLMVKRSTGKKKFDNLVILDGDEGYGKTTLSMQVAYYYSFTTGRPFNLSHVFFDIEKLIKFASETKEQVIVWDEAALGGLTDQWQNKIQMRLIQLLMVARKKRHFFIFNIPKVFKLRDYVILDRAIALVHVYARNEIELGRFVYFTKKKKELLYYDWKGSRRRNYKKFVDFRGTFPNVLAELIDEDEYDKMKDEAILSIGDEANKQSVNEPYIRMLKGYTLLAEHIKNTYPELKLNYTKIGKITGIQRQYIAKGKQLLNRKSEI